MYPWIIMTKYFVKRNYRGTCSSAEMLKGYMLICRNAERVQGQRWVANPCMRITNHGVIRTTRAGIYGTYMSSCFVYRYLCVLCYCDVCFKFSALRVGVKTLSTGCLIPILVLFTSKMQVWTFCTYYFYVNRHCLVQFLITDLKQNNRNNQNKSRQISSYVKL